MYRSLFAALIVGFSALFPGHAAASSPALQLASTVGGWIAEQGNEALRQMREELRRDLAQKIEPLLPQPDAPAERHVPQDPAAGS